SPIVHHSALATFLAPFFFFTDPPPSELYTLSLHDALPISISGFASRTGSRGCRSRSRVGPGRCSSSRTPPAPRSSCSRRCSCIRSEEHTSELQSRFDLVCRLLLEKKKKHERENTNSRNHRW